MIKIRTLLLFFAFFEGFCVMAVELFSAKLIAPYFGSSLYVWASVLGITLLSLMIGYYSGGLISKKKNKSQLLFIILALSGIFISLIPISGNFIMNQLIDYSVAIGSSISLLFYMLPALIGLGMTSPLIISILNEHVDDSGKTAGLIYGISTLGGVIGVFTTGFYLLPEFGISIPSYSIGLILSILSILPVIAKKKISLVLIIPFFFFGTKLSAISKLKEGKKLVYHSEGVMGQIKVLDTPFYTISRGAKYGRVLLVNNTAQTIGDLYNPERDLWDYSYYFPYVVSDFPENSELLLLGLGGGSLVHHFERLKFKMDIVEIDERIKEVAQKYFKVSSNHNFFINDARNFINTCKKKYDIIVLDLFLNETPPIQMLTQESISKIQNLLNEKGRIIINFYGYTTGQKGLAARSVLSTIESTGLITEILPTPGNENHRNLIFIAQKEKIDLSHCNYQLTDLPILSNIKESFIDQSKLIQDGIILKDDIPIMEKMYLKAALDWRRDAINFNLKNYFVN